MKTNHRWISLMLGISLVPSIAAAQTATIKSESSTSTATTASATTTAPAPEVDRVHKGFYFRGALGGGYGGTKFTYEGSSDELTASGAGVGLDLWFGGTPVAGLAIGGALHFQQTVSPSISVNGTKVGNSSLSLNSLLIGPFADWFPDPHGGFHLGGTVGLARLSLSDKDDDTTAQSPVGFGGAFVIGYDWWVSKEWSLGISGRFMGSAVSDENNGVKGTAVSYQPALMFSALYY